MQRLTEWGDNAVLETSVEKSFKLVRGLGFVAQLEVTWSQHSSVPCETWRNAFDGRGNAFEAMGQGIRGLG